jgi:hypothetical protein
VSLLRFALLTKENVMLRGTRILMGQEARTFTEAADRLRRRLHG